MSKFSTAVTLLYHIIYRIKHGPSGIISENLTTFEFVLSNFKHGSVNSLFCSYKMVKRFVKTIFQNTHSVISFQCDVTITCEFNLGDWKYYRRGKKYFVQVDFCIIIFFQYLSVVNIFFHISLFENISLSIFALLCQIESLFHTLYRLRIHSYQTNIERSISLLSEFRSRSCLLG